MSTLPTAQHQERDDYLVIDVCIELEPTEAELTEAHDVCSTTLQEYDEWMKRTLADQRVTIEELLEGRSLVHGRCSTVVSKVQNGRKRVRKVHETVLTFAEANTAEIEAASVVRAFKKCSGKECPEMGVDQPLSAFPTERSKKDGHGSLCWPCKRMANAARYKKPKKEAA